MTDLGLVELRRGRQFGLGGLLLVVSTSGDESGVQGGQELQRVKVCEGTVVGLAK
jgi:hypothetical protein